MKIPVKESASEEYLISKSKFIGFVILGDLKKLFLDRIHELQMGHHSANHIAFAYRIKTAHGIDDYFNDAGIETKIRSNFKGKALEIGFGNLTNLRMVKKKGFNCYKHSWHNH